MNQLTLSNHKGSSKNNEFRPEISEIPKITVDFRTGVLNIIFGNIFGNFRETFGRPKPLFYFGSLLDIKSPETPKDRESRKAKNFWPTQCLIAHPLP